MFPVYSISLFLIFPVIWRSCRGNVFVKTVEIKDTMADPETNELVEKNVFICFFQGAQLELRVNKICTGLVPRLLTMFTADHSNTGHFSFLFDL